MILESRWLNKNIILNSTMNDKEENLMEKEDRVVYYRKLCEEIQRMINDLPVPEGNCVQIEKAKRVRYFYITVYYMCLNKNNNYNNFFKLMLF